MRVPASHKKYIDPEVPLYMLQAKQTRAKITRRKRYPVLQRARIMVKPYQAHLCNSVDKSRYEFRPRRCGAEVRIEYATQKSFNTVKLNGGHIPIDGANQKILRGPVVPGVAPLAKSKIISGMSARARIEHKTSRRDIPVIRDWYAAER